MITSVNNALWYLNVLAAGWLVFRLYTQGLAGTYPFLFAYFVADVAQQVAGIAVLNLLATTKSQKSAYYWIYSGGQALKLVLAIFVVLELCRLALANHPALAKFGRKIVISVLSAISVVVTLELLVNPPDLPAKRDPLLVYTFALESRLDFATLVFLLLITTFMVWFSVRMAKNVAYYLGGFSAYYLARSAGVPLLNLRPGWTNGINVAELSASLTCLVALVFLLRREGEVEMTSVPRTANPEKLQRLTRQLNDLNDALKKPGQRE